MTASYFYSSDTAYTKTGKTSKEVRFKKVLLSAMPLNFLPSLERPALVEG